MTNTASSAARGVTKSLFGTLADNTPVDLYTLRNKSGIEARVITYGGVIVSLATPDRDGKLDDIVLGFDSLPPYVKDSPYFGAIVGRYANRIAKGRFTLDGKTYQLPVNNAPNSLHGGDRGFDKVVWDATPFDSAGGVGVVLSHVSPDGDQGYPGAVRVQVTYTLTDSNQLAVAYHATTDKATPINLSQHTYFNLTGARRDVLDHVLTLNADRYTPVDSTLIPLGELVSVAGTPFDFRTPTAIGARINANDEQLRRGRGYDHNFVLIPAASGLTHAAHVLEPTSGRTLDVYTDQPGVQFYTGNFLDGTLHGKQGRVYGHRYALCLETQHFPDSPNEPSFPSTILRPGQEFSSRTVFAFGTSDR
ncbi:MAG TPA: aldose epimerase family protein [Gemmatimonadaceae bacterium]|nr:aldose epimerase family protein [Gemmatimonadaceae bacterium]